MKNFFWSLGLFLASLYSFYFFGAPVVSILGVTLLTFLQFFSTKGVGLKLNAIFLYFASLLMLSSFGVFFGVDASFTRYIVFLSFVMISLLFSHGFGQADLKKVIGFFLFFHLIFFYLQFISYYVFSHYIGILTLFGLESRNLGGTFTLPWGMPLMRSSGLFSEPGTYSCFLAPMIAMYHKYADCNYSKIIFFAALLSLALSMSTFGLVFFFVIAVFLMSNIIMRVVTIASCFFFVLPYFIWRFFERTQEGAASGLDFRQEYIVAALNNFLSVKEFFFGHGAFAVTNFAFSEDGSDNDAGLLFYILYNFGVVALALSCVLIVIAWIKYGRAVGIGVLIIFLSKMSPFAYVFPVYLCILLSKKSRSTTSWG